MVEDIFQESFLKLCKQRKKYSPEFPFLPWFFTLCRNTMLDALKVKRSTEVPVTLDELEAITAQSEFTAEASVQYSRYLDSLNGREREILELHFIQDMPFRAVAQRLGMTGSGVRKVSSRAVEKLRRFWKE